MNERVSKAIDARQTKGWGEYLKFLNWKIEWVGKTQIFIRKFALLNLSFIKIQHPIGPLPFKKIDQIARKNKAAWALVEPHNSGYSEEEMVKNGYKKSKMMLSHTATIKIDLKRGEKDLFNSFSENARRNIRKSQKQNLEVRKVEMKLEKNWQYFDIFYSLLKNLGKMKKFYVPSYQEYESKMRAFKDGSTLLFAYDGETPICVIWFATYDNVIAYFQTGITTRGYETLANYLLLWEGLKMGQKKGLDVFDFESIFDERYPKYLPQKKRYTDFKKRFHGEIVLYPEPWIKTYSALGKLLYIWMTLV